jgi:hypothetical protein
MEFATIVINKYAKEVLSTVLFVGEKGIGWCG